MDTEKLPPIPTPASQRWREFRIQVFPFIVFFAAIIGIVYLWRGYVQPVGVIGFVETNAVNVTSLQDGLLSEVFVQRLQSVTAGQPIAVVVKTDPELIRAQVATMQAELQLTRERLSVDRDRSELAVEEMRQALLLHKVTQAKDTVNLFLYSNEFVRAGLLFTNKTISDAQFDAAKAQYESTIASIQQQEILIREMSEQVLHLAHKDRATVADPIDEAVKAKQRELELLLRPVTLNAPISGMISMIHHQPGERILRGNPVVTITDPETRRIVGYVRQPVSTVPTTNDFVRISTRSNLQRQEVNAPIIRVGAQLEPINPALLSADTKRMEVGLPILVSIPPGIRLLPGEYVNLVIVPGPAANATKPAQ